MFGGGDPTAWQDRFATWLRTSPLDFEAWLRTQFSLRGRVAMEVVPPALLGRIDVARRRVRLHV